MGLVLIVVDEPHTMLLMRGYLEGNGHQVVLAADADTALGRLAALPIDVVLLDVMMPVRDGWTVLQALADRARRLPTLVMQGRARAIDLERAMRMGATGSLAPLVSADDLNRMVSLALTPAPVPAPVPVPAPD